MMMSDVLGIIAERLGDDLVVADVGAQSLSGEDHVYAPLRTLGVPHRIIGFEPLAERAAARRAEGEANCELIEAFVGDGGPHVFHECNSSGASSLLDLDRAVCGGFVSLAGLRMVRASPVHTTTLDEALGGADVDFLKLDIQGFELPALQGGIGVLRGVAMVQAEVEFVPLYVGQPLFSELELFLRNHCFDFLDFHALARRAPVVPSGRVRNEQLLWADAVFGARLDTATDRALLSQAILSLALYDRWSMAERALAAYDRRHGTGLAASVGSEFAGARTDCLPAPPSPDASRYRQTASPASSCA